jgi:hypothetical protein
MGRACSTLGRNKKFIQNFGQNNQRIDERILEWILGRKCAEVWTGFIWLRIGTSGRLL